MNRLNFAFLANFAVLAVLAPSAHAAPEFGYSFSDTRTLLTDDPHVGEYPAWGGSLKTYTGDAPVYVNAIEATPGANFDPNLALYPAFSGLDYYDAHTGLSGRYNFGQSIAGGTDWSLREIASFDNFWDVAPAAGLYDFTVTLRGGANANATDDLATFDLHLEVAERLDLVVSASATEIEQQGDVSHVSLTVDNHMGRDLVLTNAFYDPDGMRIDPQSPGLVGTFTGDWDDKVIGAGETLTGAHSDWTAVSPPAEGVYTGGLGVVGGLHYGDLYYLYANPVTSVVVRAVPEPASFAVLGLGALGLLRRRARR